MANTDDITDLLSQLAVQRATLEQLLDQQGSADAIAEVHAAIAQITGQLRDQGVAGDSIDARGSQGFINRPTGPVTQHFYPRMPIARPEISLDQARQLLDRLPLDVIPDPALLPPGSRMPLRRNPLFVGRDADLTALAQVITTGQVAAITTGIGGVGKTQLIVEFAHRYGQFFAGGVFWLSFSADIDVEIAACGGVGALELYTDADRLKQAEQVQRVYAAWAQATPRLLIFDNCDDQEGITAEQLLTDRLPRSGGCRVLVTSRRGQWSTGLHLATLALKELERTASVALLRSYREDLSDADAEAIAAEVGDLPLALTLAGSYLATYRDESFGVPARYLANLRKKLLDHQSMQGKDAAPSLTNHEQNVRVTFALSYERLNEDNPTDALAIAALARAACLAPGEPFPRDLLLATLGETTEDEEVAAQRANAIRRLVALGLVEGAASGALRMHRLIAAFAQGATGDAGAQGAVAGALIERASQINDAGYPAPMQNYLAHLRYVTDITWYDNIESTASLCTHLGYYLEMVGNYVAARPLFERSLAIVEQVLGPTHPDTALSLNNLALLLESQGDYAAARPLYERALAIVEWVLEPAHPQAVTILNNLVSLLRKQGNYVRARLLLDQALIITEQVLGQLHPQTASCLNNLALLLESQGDYVAAQSLYEQALSIREQVLGPTHPHTAAILHNLANLFQKQGNYLKAQSLAEHARTIVEQTLGLTHPDTASSLHSLANLLELQGDYVKAQSLLEQALMIQEQTLGPTHPRQHQACIV